MKNACSRFFFGFVLPLRGIRLLWVVPGARYWALLPLFCNIILYGAVFALMIWLLKDWQFFSFSWNFWGEWGARFANWINAGGQVLRWLIGIPLFLFISYFTFAFCGELLASPFNDFLSEKIENHLTGRRDFSSTLRMTGRSVWLSIGSSLRILLRQLFWTGITLPLLFVPFVGQCTWLALNGYFTGIAYLDTAMARNFLEYRHKIAGIRQYRWEICGLGIALTLLFAIPFLGILMFPAGVSGACILYCGIDWREIFARNSLPLPAGFVPPAPRRPTPAPHPGQTPSA